MYELLRLVFNDYCVKSMRVLAWTVLMALLDYLGLDPWLRRSLCPSGGTRLV